MTSPAPARTIAAWLTAVVALLAAAWVLATLFANSHPENLNGYALLLAGVWLVAGLTVVLLVPRPATEGGTPPARRPLVLSLATGLAISLAALVGGLLLHWIPQTRFLVAGPLEAASTQSAWALLAVSLVAGACEEVFFRLGLPRLLRGWVRWVVPLTLYVLVTLASGSPALALMAGLLGATAMWVLDRTRWWPAPLIVHAMWTLTMIGLFPLLAL